MPIRETWFTDYNYSVVREAVAPQQRWSVGGGMVQTRRRWARPSYRFKLRCLQMDRDEAQALYGFATYHQGDIPFWLESVRRDGFEFGVIDTPILIGYGDGVKSQFFMPNRNLLSMAPGMMGYWLLDEGTGSFASDATQRGNNGVITGAAWGTRTIPIVTPALVYNGSTTSISVPIVSMLDGFPGLTLEAWVLTSTLATNRAIISKHASGRRSYLLFMTPDHTLQFNVYSPNDIMTAIGTLPGLAPQGVWFHVAATWHPEGMALYVNGNLVGSGSSIIRRMQQTGGPVEIGYDSVTGWRITGAMDDVRIWGYVRSQAEIAAFQYNNIFSQVSFWVDGIQVIPVGWNLASGLITFAAPIAVNRRITAVYPARYKVVFAVEGDVLLSEENFVKALMSVEGITLMEIVP